MHSDYLRLSNKDKLMSIYRKMGDEIHLLERLYRELKWHGLANRNDICNIVQQEEKLKNLDKVMYESAGEIGQLNSIKMKLEKEVEERMKRIDRYDYVIMKTNLFDMKLLYPIPYLLGLSLLCKSFKINTVVITGLGFIH